MEQITKPIWTHNQTHLFIYCDVVGFGYAERLILTGTDTVSPIAAPDAPIKVADLLP